MQCSRETRLCRTACSRGYPSASPRADLFRLLVSRRAAADDPANPFQGEWRTTVGVVKLEQKGDEVTGTYGAGDQFPIKGTAKGKVLTFEYVEGQVKGDGRFTIDASPNAFTGTFQIRNGRARRLERLAARPEGAGRQGRRRSPGSG